MLVQILMLTLGLMLIIPLTLGVRLSRLTSPSIAGGPVRIT